MLELNPESVESSELVDQTFNFWFTDQGHIRSPFPLYIQNELRKTATEKFYMWAANLNPAAKDEVNEEVVAEKFEEIIFETGTSLVLTEDEKLTIQYPFMPRLEDKLNDADNPEKGESKVVDRFILKEGDTSYMQLKMENLASQEKWETRFELPM